MLFSLLQPFLSESKQIDDAPQNINAFLTNHYRML